jgi:hypothetical protein
MRLPPVVAVNNPLLWEQTGLRYRVKAEDWSYSVLLFYTVRHGCKNATLKAGAAICQCGLDCMH